MTQVLARGRLAHLADRFTLFDLLFPVIPAIAILLLIDLLSPVLHTPDRWPEPDRVLHGAIQQDLRSWLRWWLAPLYLLLWVAFLWYAGEVGMGRLREAFLNINVLALFCFLLSVRGIGTRSLTTQAGSRQTNGSGLSR